MTYDINMIKDFYASYAQKVNMIRSKVGRPLTYAEKVLFSHASSDVDNYDYSRGTDYATFQPNRVCMQDATAQMAILQFMNAGRAQTVVRSLRSFDTSL